MDERQSDRKIVQRLLAGDEAAFGAVFDSFFPRLYRFALSRLNGDAEEARDLVQQTFCRAFERLDSYRGEASLYGWMCQICRNALIDRARRRQTEHRFAPVGDGQDNVGLPADALQPMPAALPEQELTRLHLLQLIQATLDFLPSHYGDVLELKYIDELSVNDIANRLEIGPKAAESLLMRARNAFRDAIVTLGDSADLLPLDLKATIER